MPSNAAAGDEHLVRPREPWPSRGRGGGACRPSPSTIRWPGRTARRTPTPGHSRPGTNQRSSRSRRRRAPRRSRATRPPDPRVGPSCSRSASSCRSPGRRARRCRRRRPWRRRCRRRPRGPCRRAGASPCGTPVPGSCSRSASRSPSRGRRARPTRGRGRCCCCCCGHPRPAPCRPAGASPCGSREPRPSIPWASRFRSPGRRSPPSPVPPSRRTRPRRAPCPSDSRVAVCDRPARRHRRGRGPRAGAGVEQLREPPGSGWRLVASSRPPVTSTVPSPRIVAAWR